MVELIHRYRAPWTIDHIRYDILTQDALRGVVRTVLEDAARNGLPGEHHFYVAFDTRAEGVKLSQRMRAQYPEEMTVVLQHQFWDLVVADDQFEVGLSFGGVPERVVVPVRGDQELRRSVGAVRGAVRDAGRDDGRRNGHRRYRQARRVRLPSTAPHPSVAAVPTPANPPPANPPSAKKAPAKKPETEQKDTACATTRPPAAARS